MGIALNAAAYVKPYVKRQKNDAADAEAICIGNLVSAGLIGRTIASHIGLNPETLLWCSEFGRLRDILKELGY